MLDEREIIELITSRSGKLPAGYLPIGDDVAMIPQGRPGERVVLKCDMLVARTDVPPGMTWRMAARKAVAMCVSDFAAKGVRPSSFMVSIGLPRGTPKGRIVGLAAGLAEASKEWGVRLVGGDTGVADDLVVDCSMAGFARRVVRRSGAKPEEYVVTTGPFGQTAAGLRILIQGATASQEFRARAISSLYMPSPKLEAGLALSRFLSSSMDSSDGLAISLHTISEMSGIGIKVTGLPLADRLEEFAAANSVAEEELALYGGEEYEVVGTIPKDRLGVAQRVARSLGCELRIVGETTRAFKGVLFSDGRKVRKDGWVHFRSGP